MSPSATDPGDGARPARILVVDNYDSFVYNLVQYLAELGAEVVVRRNDQPGADQLGGVDGVLVSPGPGRPQDAGVSVAVTARCLEQGLPLLGVCLGHQALGVVLGAEIVRAPELRHGKTSAVDHDGTGVLAGLPDPLTVTRYHSLAVDEAGLPPEAQVTARTGSGIVMALRHRELPAQGVQFHPESVLSEGGYRMLATWLADCGQSVPVERVERLQAAADARRAGAFAVPA